MDSRKNGAGKVTTGPRNFKIVLKRFWLSLREWRVQIIVAAILSLVSTVMSLFGPMILGMMTTSATESLKNSGEIAWGEINFLAMILGCNNFDALCEI